MQIVINVSDLGPEFSGTVDINTPDIDAAAGLLELAESPVDAARLIRKNLCDPGDTSQFTVTGRGGFPRSPSEVIHSPLVWDDLQFFGDRPNEVPRGSSQVESQSPLLSDDLPIVEAQGWLVKESGTVVLVATSPHVTPPRLRLPSCRGVQVQGSAIAEQQRSFTSRSEASKRPEFE
jgi:large exoprotein involved in heme utilization and adhesion